jgi:hypothetical protein
MGHLAPRGLVYYGQVFDRFFHDEIPRQPELPAPALVASRDTGDGLPSRPDPRSRPSAVGLRDASSATPLEDGASTANPESTHGRRKGKP